ncbi:MAG: hypothetical protein AAFX79_08620 [Planctomycetota bacterium]
MPPARTAQLQRRALARTDAVAALALVLLAGALLLPAGAGARDHAARTATAGNIAGVARAITQMATDEGLYPLAYAYGGDASSAAWDPGEQRGGHPTPAYGYVHFSGMLLDRGYAADESLFASPGALRGGAPRANPGGDPADWEPGQVDELGRTMPGGGPTDRQARRLAFTANGAIMPQPRLAPSGTERHFEQVALPRRGGGSNAFTTRVPTEVVRDPARTALLTEWLATADDGWFTLSRGLTIKSHRPIEPFQGMTAGRSPEREPVAGSGARFVYPRTDEIFGDGGSFRGVLTGTGSTDLNAMGRQHAGGRTHLAMADGSVLLRTPLESVAQRLWGEEFYSITGNDRVRP